jgi:predicted permease
VTAVLVLGLGLGANTVLFNAVHALLWRPLPFPDSGRLVALQHRSPRGVIHGSTSGRNVADIRNHVPGVAEIGLVSGAPPIAVALGNDIVDLESAGVNSGYLRALGLRPLAGHLFGEEDDLGQAREKRAILTESAWRTYFGADPAIAGRVVDYIDASQRKQIRIVGVVSDRYTLPYASSAKVLTSIPWLMPAVQANRGNMVFQTVMRLKPGLGLAEVSGQVTAALRASEQELPAERRGNTSWLEPLRTVLVASFRTPVWLLYAAAGLLLLLTVANVASLFLARAIARTHETALRAALGATLSHTLRAFLLEALLVCGAGLVLAFTVDAWVRALVPQFVPELGAVGASMLEPGGVLVAFGVAVCLLVAVAIAVLPTMQARRTSLVESLGQAGRGGTARTSWRGVLAAAQLAIILVLLGVGSLIGRSFVWALHTDPGFDADHVVTFKATLPVAMEGRTAAAYDLSRAISSVAGTVRVGFSGEAPIGNFYAAAHSGREGDLRATDPVVAFRLVDSGYFRAIGARFVTGRAFTPAEVQDGRAVTVLNEAGARLLFPDSDPIGRVVHSALNDMKLTVVGVIRDIKTNGLDLRAPEMIYIPYMPFFSNAVVFSVRTSVAPDAYEAALRDRVKGWNANAVVRDFQPLQADLRKTVQGRFRASALIGLFAILGLFVGSVGLYATIAANVQRLAKEIGVRMALGATTRSVLVQVLGQGARVLACGVAAGLAGTVAAARLVSRHLYGVGPLDAASFAIALALLCGAALLATLLPALRASRIDPAEALRSE